jgi:hypothetical protein
MGGNREPAQLAPQVGEAGAPYPVEVGRLHGQGLQPVRQAGTGADQAFGREGAEFAEQGGPARGEAGAQAGQHRLLGDAIEHQPAAGRQERKALIELGFQLAAAAAEQGAEALVEAEAAVLRTDEIQHREAALAGVGGEAQAPAQLLQEHHGALGGPQQQHGVDGGDVEPCVVEVDREEDAQVAGGLALGGQRLRGGHAGCRLQLAGRGPRGCLGYIGRGGTLIALAWSGERQAGTRPIALLCGTR